MRVEILLSKEIADQLVKSNSENLKAVGERYFRTEEYSNTHDYRHTEGMWSYMEEEIEATEEEIDFLEQIGSIEKGEKMVIAISNKQAEEFLNSGNETLQKLARDFFEEEEFSKEFDEDIFADSEDGEVISVHEIEVSEKVAALVKEFKQKRAG